MGQRDARGRVVGRRRRWILRSAQQEPSLNTPEKARVDFAQIYMNRCYVGEKRMRWCAGIRRIRRGELEFWNILKQILRNNVNIITMFYSSVLNE